MECWAIEGLILLTGVGESGFPRIEKVAPGLIVIQGVSIMMEQEQDIRAKHHLDFKAVLYAGLVVGVLFLFLPRGIPWNSIGLPTEAMGRPLFAQDTHTAMFITGIVQILMSLAYTFVVAAVIYRFRMFKAVIIGGVIGLGLYALNYLVFRYVVPTAPNKSEFAVLLTHLAFCFIVAGAYKGISVPPPKEQRVKTG